MITKVIWQEKEFELLEQPVEIRDPEKGVIYRAKVTDGTGEYLMDWYTTGAYDYILSQVEMERKSVDLCEYVSEEELFRRVHGLKYYDSIENRCCWERPFRVSRESE